MVLLSQVQEVVLHQLQVVDQISEQCLKEIAGYISYLVADRHQDVKKWMISILCELVKEKEASLLQQAVETIYHVMLSCLNGTDAINTQANLLKACLQGLTDVFPLTFQRACFFPQEFQTTWQYVMTMKEMIYNQLLIGENEGLRTHAIKFFQTLIIVFSAPFGVEGQEMDLSGVDIHADLIADDHVYLSKRQIIQEARHQLEHLLGQVHSKSMSSGNVLAILNAMGSILKSRQQYLPMVIDALLPLQKHPPLHLTPLQIKSLHHTLKLLLQSILKLPSVEPYKAAVQEVWTILSGKVAAKSLKFAADRRTLTSVTHKRAVSSEEMGFVDSVADTESKRQRMHVDPELQKTLFNHYQFPYPFMLDIVMISMLNLPSRMPGYVVQQMADLSNRRALSIGDQRKDPRKLDTRLQTRAQMTVTMDGLSQQLSLVRTSTGSLPLQSLAADIASFGQAEENHRIGMTPIEMMNRIVEVSHGLRDVQGLLMSRMTRDELSAQASFDRMGLGLATKSEISEEIRRVRAKPFVLEVTESYSFDKLATILKSVFERLISSETEQLANDTGTRKSWITLICKLITTDISDSIEMDHLKDLMRERLDTFILENFKERYELAISWMYHEYAADEQRKFMIVKEEKKSIKVRLTMLMREEHFLFSFILILRKIHNTNEAFFVFLLHRLFSDIYHAIVRKSNIPSIS